MRRYQAYGEMQSALGQLYAVLGLDPLPQEAAALDIASLTHALRNAVNQRGTPGGKKEAADIAAATGPAPADAHASILVSQQEPAQISAD